METVICLFGIIYWTKFTICDVWQSVIHSLFCQGVVLNVVCGNWIMMPSTFAFRRESHYCGRCHGGNTKGYVSDISFWEKQLSFFFAGQSPETGLSMVTSDCVNYTHSHIGSARDRSTFLPVKLWYRPTTFILESQTLSTLAQCITLRRRRFGRRKGNTSRCPGQADWTTGTASSVVGVDYFSGRCNGDSTTVKTKYEELSVSYHVDGQRVPRRRMHCVA